MKSISYIKKLQDKVNNVNKDLPNIESKVNNDNTIINNVANKISNIDAPLSSLLNKSDLLNAQKLIEIKVTDADPNEQITATCGDKTIKTQADSTGTGYLNPTKYGDWTVNGKLLSVTSAKQHVLSLIPNLSEATWTQIAKVSNSGKASKYWKIGDEKDIQVGSETLTFQIYGFNHDDLADGSGKAGITLGMKNLMATQRRMEATKTNTNSFIGSEMYKWLNGECFNSLPSDLKSLIKPVNKKTSAGNLSTSIRTDAMKLWLFSENEVFGTKTYSTGNEGTKYPIFTTNNSRIKKLSNGTGDANWWWLRSPRASYSNGFCIVYNGGTADTDIAFYEDGVCFGFSI